jgi:primosomal protein N' (replication factor Y)
MQTAPRFVDVLLPLHLPRSLTYRVPDGWPSLEVGQRVVVPLRKKLYTGIVRALHHTRPEAYEPRVCEDLLDEQPLISGETLAFWDWMAAYYLCYPGDVMLAALPSVFRISSETVLQPHPAYVPDAVPLTDDEYLVLEALTNNGSLQLSDVQRILGRQRVIPLLKELARRELLQAVETLQGGFREKREAFVQLHPELLTDDSRLRDIFQQLERAPRQLDALMIYLQQKPGGEPLARKELLKHPELQTAAITALVQKNILQQQLIRVDRVPLLAQKSEGEQSLSETQARALAQIKVSWEQKELCLLQGITGSGKTLVYVSLIGDALAAGKQVLYMVPEIALTAQLIERLRRFLGTEIGIYHSRFSEQERAEIWQKVANGSLRMVLGARSSVFLPFSELGLVVIDEEHDASYKQDEPAPRYHARDAALVLARNQQAKVLLGSATPSLETYHLARSGRYGYVRLDQRYGGVQLPDIRLADIRMEQRERLMKADLTGSLFNAISDTLERGEQVILLQNRRGYVPYTECSSCGWTPGCPNCDITLTYHKLAHQWRCHYCGHKELPVPSCKACGSTALVTRGFGTEKIEEEISILFPEASVGRLDQDSTRKKHAYGQIIRDFENGKIQILIGTQMVSKGLDFDKVTLVGVLNADMALRIPDFRAPERTFQLLEQVSGRAGRRDIKGTVIIQTRMPKEPLFALLQEHDFDSFADAELQQRLSHQYPPYVRLIRITLRHKNYETLEKAANELCLRLREQLAHRVLGPATPSIGRIRQEYIREVLIKLEREKLDPARVKDFLLRQLEWLETDTRWKGLRNVVDVDPV